MKNELEDESCVRVVSVVSFLSGLVKRKGERAGLALRVGLCHAVMFP